MSSFVGIDLGTCFSAIAYIDKTGRPQIIPNKDGENITPSVVSLRKDGDRDDIEVGTLAYTTWGYDKKNTAARFKRQMHEDTLIEMGGNKYTPARLSAYVLEELVKDAKSTIKDIEEVVISIPANFPNIARVATLEAGKIAGLNVNFIVNEPVGAALGYAFLNQEAYEGIYAVYDFGGGTFDFSVIEIKSKEFNVLATNGIQKCGGDDLDQILFELIESKYKDITGENIEFEEFNTTHSEKAKKALSTRERHQVKVGKEIIEIDRKEFEEAIETLVLQTEVIVKKTLEEASLSPINVNEVFLVGGSTRVPAIKRVVEQLFEGKVTQSINPDEVVALGAAIFAGMKGDKSKMNPAGQATIAKLSVNDISSKCFGTIYLDTYVGKSFNKVIIEKGEQLPCSRTERFELISDFQESITCRITESVAPEENIDFVNVLWEGVLDLSNPNETRVGDPIDVTYSYDENQVMHCEFKEIRSGISKKVNLDLYKFNTSGSSEDINIE